MSNFEIQLMNETDSNIEAWAKMENATQEYIDGVNKTKFRIDFVFHKDTVFSHMELIRQAIDSVLIGVGAAGDSSASQFAVYLNKEDCQITLLGYSDVLTGEEFSPTKLNQPYLLGIVEVK